MRRRVQPRLRLLLTLLMYLFLVQCLEFDEEMFVREPRGLCTDYAISNFNFPSKIGCAARCMSDNLCIGFCFKVSASECNIYALNRFVASAFTHGYRTYYCTSSTSEKTGAANLCQSYGASVLVPLNEHENKVIRMAPSTVLIGINDINKEKTWVLNENNSPISFTKWRSGQPDNAGGNEDCAEADTATGAWNDLPCSYTRGVCCQSPSAGKCPNVPFGNNESEDEKCFIKKGSV